MDSAAFILLAKHNSVRLYSRYDRGAIFGNLESWPNAGACGMKTGAPAERNEGAPSLVSGPLQSPVPDAGLASVRASSKSPRRKARSPTGRPSREPNQTA